jgi:precorrin-6B methylase 2
MSFADFLRRSFLTLTLSLFAAGAFAQEQQAKEQFEPQVGQSGKDVVWVPTPQALVDRMLGLAKLTPKDYLMDLGSGDGRTVITAVKRGARATGIEYNPDMVELSKRIAAKEGVGDKAEFIRGDIFETDFSKATVITLFLLPDLNIKLRPKILDMKPGTRVVSNSFTMGEWKSDQTVTATDGCTSYCTAYLWIVPAKVAGTWKLADGELTLRQDFQMLGGTLKTGGNSASISNAKMNGDQISFSAGGVQYTGRVSGNAMEGTTKGGTKWSATRAGK